MPCTHTPNPMFERQNHVVEQNLRILMNHERTKDWVRLVRWAVLTMNSQRSSSTGFTRQELLHGGHPLRPWRQLLIARWQQKKIKNKEKDAQPDKITRKIVFSDLRNPPNNFTPLFGEVAKYRTLTEKDEQ